MVSGSAFACGMMYFTSKVGICTKNILRPGIHFLAKIQNSTKKLEFCNSGSKTSILDKELLGFSQFGGLWQFCLGFFTPTHDPRGFYGNFANSHVRVPFFVIPMLFTRADGGKSKTPRAQP